jgi:hypothetical protein
MDITMKSTSRFNGDTEQRSGDHEWNFINKPDHALHRCRTAEEFNRELLELLGSTPRDIASKVVVGDAPMAIFLVGSIPLAQGTSGSDIDMIVVVDSPSLEQTEARREGNTDRSLAFYRHSSSVIQGNFVFVEKGVEFDVCVVVLPRLEEVYQRLQRKGPELDDREIMVLSRLKTGWLLHNTPGYLEGTRTLIESSLIDFYCSTRNFTLAIKFFEKAAKAQRTQDALLTAHFCRQAVELSWLAYCAGLGYSYLGARWLPFVLDRIRGEDRGAGAPTPDVDIGHPLSEGIALLFPAHDEIFVSYPAYLSSTLRFMCKVREEMEKDSIIKLALAVTPQIYSLRERFEL